MSKLHPATLDKPENIELAHQAVRNLLDVIDELGINSVNCGINEADRAAITIRRAYRAAQDMRDALNTFAVIYG